MNLYLKVTHLVDVFLIIMGKEFTSLNEGKTGVVI